MILIFACILAGIIIGVGGSFLWRYLPEEEVEGDLADLIHDIKPDETPLLTSVMEKHRLAHLAARPVTAYWKADGTQERVEWPQGGSNGTDNGLSGGSAERGDTGKPRAYPE